MFSGGGTAAIYSKSQHGKFFSKDYTNVLKGLCCLIVIYVHIHDNFQNKLQDAIGSFAYVCVTVFFLISAYGMMLSIKRKEDYLNNFWRNRLASLLVPCVLINIVSFCSCSFQGFFTWNVLFHLNGYVWVLLQFCIWFYIVEVCKKKYFPNNEFVTDIILISGIAISSLYMYIFCYGNNSSMSGWCFERIGLVYGILLYRFFNPFVKWIDDNRNVKFIIFIFLDIILGIAYLKYKYIWLFGEYFLKILLGLVIIISLFIVTSTRTFYGNVNLWLGNISYEVYLSHGLIMSTLEFYCPFMESGLYILLTVILTLILSALINNIGKPIIKLLRY